MLAHEIVRDAGSNGDGPQDESSLELLPPPEGPSHDDHPKEQGMVQRGAVVAARVGYAFAGQVPAGRKETFSLADGEVDAQTPAASLTLTDRGEYVLMPRGAPVWLDGVRVRDRERTLGRNPAYHHIRVARAHYTFRLASNDGHPTLPGAFVFFEPHGEDHLVLHAGRPSLLGWGPGADMHVCPLDWRGRRTVPSGSAVVDLVAEVRRVSRHAATVVYQPETDEVWVSLCGRGALLRFTVCLDEVEPLAGGDAQSFPVNGEELLVVGPVVFTFATAGEVARAFERIRSAVIESLELEEIEITEDHAIDEDQGAAVAVSSPLDDAKVARVPIVPPKPRIGPAPSRRPSSIHVSSEIPPLLPFDAPEKEAS